MSQGYSTRLIKAIKEADGKLLGVRLGRACVSNDVSVAEVAAKLFVSRQAVYNWFVGISIPSKTSAKAINQLLTRLTQR